MSDDEWAYDVFFRRYAETYQQSLGAHVETAALRAFFAEEFLALSLDGRVKAGKNDESFVAALEQGFRFIKALGTMRMDVDRVESVPIHEGHDRVRVFYVAQYRRRDATDVTIPFDVTYLLQRREGGPKIFAFIAGDEMAVYRRHGLVDEQGHPA